jgi:hypothetical protein
MFTFEYKQIVVFIKKDHLVQGCFITALFENYSQLLVAESAVSFLKAFQSVLCIFRVPHEVKLV